MNNPVLTLSQSMTDGRIELGGGPRNTNDWLSGGLQDGFRLIDVVVWNEMNLVSLLVVYRL